MWDVDKDIRFEVDVILYKRGFTRFKIETNILFIFESQQESDNCQFENSEDSKEQ